MQQEYYSCCMAYVKDRQTHGLYMYVFLCLGVRNLQDATRNFWLRSVQRLAVFCRVLAVFGVIQEYLGNGIS
jgi:hypothetical protein